MDEIRMRFDRRSIEELTHSGYIAEGEFNIDTQESDET